MIFLFTSSLSVQLDSVGIPTVAPVAYQLCQYCNFTLDPLGICVIVFLCPFQEAQTDNHRWSFLAQQALESEWLMPRSTAWYPSVGVKMHGAESELWGEE